LKSFGKLLFWRGDFSKMLQWTARTRPRERRAYWSRSSKGQL